MVFAGPKSVTAITILLFSALAGCASPAAGSFILPRLDSSFIAEYEVEGKTWRILKNPPEAAPFRLQDAGDLILVERETSVEGSYTDKWFEVKQGTVTRSVNNCLTIYADHGCSRKYVEIEWIDRGLPWFFGTSLLADQTLASDASLNMVLGHGSQEVGLRLEMKSGPARGSVLVEARVNRTVIVSDPFLSLEGNLVFRSSSPVPVGGMISWTARDAESGALGTHEANFVLLRYEAIQASLSTMEPLPPGYKFPLKGPFSGYYPPGFDFRLPVYNVSPQYLAERGKASEAYSDLASNSDFAIGRIGIRAQREMSVGPSDFASKRDVTARVLVEGVTIERGRAVEVDWTTTLVANESVNNSTQVVRDEALPPAHLPPFFPGAAFISYEDVWRYVADRAGVPYQMYFVRDELGGYSYSFHVAASRQEQEEQTVGGQAEYWSTIVSTNAASGNFSFLRTSARVMPCFNAGVTLAIESTCRPYPSDS